jgi:4-hydroxy-3-methylbut-2-enyl diphosphate reductase
VQGLLETPADLAIVIGGYNSSNTSHLVELCEEKLPTYFIKNEECLESAASISHFDLHTHAEKLTENYLPQNRPLRVMITSGASCPDALVERVIERLAELTGNSAALEIIANKWTAN